MHHYIVGDLNAKNKLWRPPKTDQKGKMISSNMEELFISLNTGQITRISPSGNASCLDLASATKKCAACTHWAPIPAIWGSDHFPCQVISGTQLTGCQSSGMRCN